MRGAAVKTAASKVRGNTLKGTNPRRATRSAPA
jgi:hypothetical protein